MNSNPEKPPLNEAEELKILLQKNALLEKQLAWEKLRADALDIMINIAEKQLQIDIRKKSGSQLSEK